MENKTVTRQKDISLTGANIVQKLGALFDEMMKDSDFIPPMLRPTVTNLVRGYLSKADPQQVRQIIQRIDSEILPWLLE